MQSIIQWWWLSLHPLVLLLLAWLIPCPYHLSGMGGGVGGGVDDGGGSGRQQLLLKWRGVPALKANTNSDGDRCWCKLYLLLVEQNPCAPRWGVSRLKKSLGYIFC